MDRYRYVKTCTVDKCDGLHKAYGYCSVHYRRFKRNGNPHREQPAPRREKEPRTFVNKGRTCSMFGCEKAAHTRGMCQKHYGQEYYHEKSEGERKRQRTGCKEKGCQNKHHATGLCRHHYEAKRNQTRQRPRKSLYRNYPIAGGILPVHECR